MLAALTVVTKLCYSPCVHFRYEWCSFFFSGKSKVCIFTISVDVTRNNKEIWPEMRSMNP